MSRVPDVTWFTNDIREPVASSLAGAFDLVICSKVLEHCDREADVLRNLLALVKPGGHVIVTVPGGPRYRMDGDLGHLRHYRLQDAYSFFPAEQADLLRAYRWGAPFSI